MPDPLDAVDRHIINALQEGFPICQRPFEAAGRMLDLSEPELMARVTHLLECGVLSRFGPMYRIERGGGSVCLAAMCVPDEEVEQVAAMLNALPAVAHNYQREHACNLWFVLAVESEAALDQAVRAIEACSGHEVLLFPKEKEYFLDLRFAA